MITKAEIQAAIYTPERAMWLDPEDLDEMVEDVMKAVATNLDATLEAIRTFRPSDPNFPPGWEE